MPEPVMDIVSDTARVQARRHYNERLAQEAQGNVVPIAAAAAAQR
jgi:hypothetical protein